MYLTAYINGRDVKITEADFDRGWVYLTYIEDDTEKLRLFVKKVLILVPFLQLML